MPKTLQADANPEKRLFVSLITRDISLADAFLDLIDNSINAVLERYAENLTSTEGYQRLLEDDQEEPSVRIGIEVSKDRIEVQDNASGISADAAENHVFHFGRSASADDSRDRLSVYGIGLKRALFKMGKQFLVESDHEEGGFSMDVDVPAWEQNRQTPWTFQIEAREPVQEQETGTLIRISNLHPDVRAKISDGIFLTQLRKKIARTYTFFLGRIVEVTLNGEKVETTPFLVSENATKVTFEKNGVSCAVIAGVAAPNSSGKFLHENAGWYVFCNGRTVIYADKSELTGWRGGTGLPTFQPKHRPFLGIVLFVSENPELLPWTTTKSSVDEESLVWQDAYRRMISVGKDITKYLDNRYKSSDVKFKKAELNKVSMKHVSPLKSGVSNDKKFITEPLEPDPTVRVQYSVSADDVELVKTHLGRSSMSAADVGRYTFEYYLRNKVEADG